MLGCRWDQHTLGWMMLKHLWGRGLLLLLVADGAHVGIDLRVIGF